MYYATSIDGNGRVLQAASSQQNNVSITSRHPDAVDLLDTPPPTSKSYWNGTEWLEQSEQPSTFHIYDWVTKQWIDPRSLVDFKDAKWEEMKKARTAAIDAPLTTPYGVFDSSPSARTSITDAVLLLQTLASLGTPTTIDFTLADNSVVTLNTTQMVQVGLMLGQKVQVAHSRARVLRLQGEAATTVAEVEAITWE
jgi:hypothetical protein